MDLYELDKFSRTFRDNINEFVNKTISKTFEEAIETVQEEKEDVSA